MTTDEPLEPSRPSEPSLWATVLVVWGTYEGSNAVGLIYRATEDRWPSEMLNPLSWGMWRRVFGDAWHSIQGAPISFWIIAGLGLLPMVLMTVLGLVAVWRSRREGLVIGGAALLLIADIVQLQDGGSNVELWRVGWHLTVLGAAAFVLSGWRHVPLTSWLLLLPLSVAVFFQRWWPLIMLLLLFQVGAAVGYHRLRRPALRVGEDVEQRDAADEAHEG